jgi:hypothetical protein
MLDEREHVHEKRPPRRPIAIGQPSSTAALRPSQRRAAEHRRLVARERAVERWLRRLARR